MPVKRNYPLPFAPYAGEERPTQTPFRNSLRWSSVLQPFLTVDEWEWDLCRRTLPSLGSDSFYADGNGGGVRERLYVRFTEGNFRARVDLLRYLADCRAWFDYYAGLGPQPSLTAPPMRAVDQDDPCNLLPSNRTQRPATESVPPAGGRPRRAKASPLIAKVRVRSLFLALDPDEEARRYAMRQDLESRAHILWLEKGRG